jgi:hypothetical protein
VTNIVSDTTAVLTIVQPMSYISCDGVFTNTLEPWVYVGGPENILSGNSIIFTAGPYATTFQTTTFTITFPSVLLENLAPTEIIWNVRLFFETIIKFSATAYFGYGQCESWYCKGTTSARLTVRDQRRLSLWKLRRKLKPPLQPRFSAVPRALRMNRLWY